MSKSSGPRNPLSSKGVLLGMDPLPDQGEHRATRIVLIADGVRNIEFPSSERSEQLHPNDDYRDNCLDVKYVIKNLCQSARSPLVDDELLAATATSAMLKFDDKWGLDRLPLQTRVQYSDLCLFCKTAPIDLPDFRRIIRYRGETHSGEWGPWKWDETISVPVAHARHDEHFPRLPIEIPGISSIVELGSGIIAVTTDDTY